MLKSTSPPAASTSRTKPWNGNSKPTPISTPKSPSKKKTTTKVNCTVDHSTGTRRRKKSTTFRTGRSPLIGSPARPDPADPTIHITVTGPAGPSTPTPEAALLLRDAGDKNLSFSDTFLTALFFSFCYLFFAVKLNTQIYLSVYECWFTWKLECWI